MKLTGSQILIKLLERQGISCIAGIPGGSNLPMYDALEKSSIRHILVRHEQGAGFIAQGLARTSNVPAVCFATSGPGATNLITALADAYLDSVPVVAITGQVLSTLIGSDAFQEVDIVSMAQKITKKSYSIARAEELLSVIPEAFSLAQSGKPGPVVIDIPKDVQLEVCTFDAWPEPGSLKRESIGTEVKINERIDQMIRSAKRPLMYIGGGASRSSETMEFLKSIAEKLNIPIVSTLMGMGAINVDNPLFLGMAGMHGSAAANMIMDRCDLLFAIGVRFGDRATGMVSKFTEDKRIIHVNIDQREAGKIVASHINLAVDAVDLLYKITTDGADTDFSEWLEEILAIKKEYQEPGTNNGKIHPQHLLTCIGNAAEPDAIITTDVGQHQMWVAQYYPFTGNGRLLTSGGLGTMGFGLPAAIGAALCNPEKQVICFSGDGSIMMNIQELATLCEQELDVKIIVFNNNHLGMVRQQQDFFYGGKRMASRFLKTPDIVMIAKGFGIDGVRINDNYVSDAIIRPYLKKKGPMLIEIKIDEDLNVLPMVFPGAANTKMIRN